MSEIVGRIVDWTQATFAPLGAWGLFLLAFIEASFFPIPPDLLLLVLSLAKPEFALWYALVCTIGSTLGGMFGYGIGLVGEKAILEKLFSKKKIEKVHNMFQKYEVWGIAIAGFSPIPYKVFAVAAGVFYLDFKKFVIATFFSRGARFFLEALLIMLFGEVIMAFIKSSFNTLTLLIVAVVLAGYFLYYQIKKPSARRKKGKRE